MGYSFPFPRSAFRLPVSGRTCVSSGYPRRHEASVREIPFRWHGRDG